MGYPDEYFNTDEDDERPLANLTRDDYLTKFSQSCPADEEIEKPNEIKRTFKLRNGQ